MNPSNRPANINPTFTVMTERAFWIAITPLSQAEQAHALDLFRRRRYAATRADDGRPPLCAAPWKNAASALATELQHYLATRHPGRPTILPVHAAQIDALRGLAITAARRGFIE